MEAVLQVVQRINFYLSDYILVFLLIGTGLYFSVRTRFVQVRCFGAIKCRFLNILSEYLIGFMC